MSINSINSIGTITTSPDQKANTSNNTDFASVLNNSRIISGTDLDSIFEAAAKKYNIPVSLLKAVAKVESNFHANATSRCGAMGIMQLMPRTAKSLGVVDAYDPEQNIMGGAKYLSKLLNEFHGDTGRALAAYNAGPGNVRKYDGIPPFAQGYVDKVLRNCGGDIPTGSPSAITNTSLYLKNDLSNTADNSIADSLTSALVLSTMYQMQMLEDIGGEQDEQNVIFRTKE
jgi:hypothetical protein